MEVKLCEVEVTKVSSGEFLTPSRHGPGSCLRILLELLLKTQNSLVREARKLTRQDDRSVVWVQGWMVWQASIKVQLHWWIHSPLVPSGNTLFPWRGYQKPSWSCAIQRESCCLWFCLTATTPWRRVVRQTAATICPPSKCNWCDGIWLENHLSKR